MFSLLTVTSDARDARRAGRFTAGLVGLGLALSTAALSAAPAAAQTVGRGPGGQTLTVSKTSGISRAGETVTVSGAGYDTDKGIYVAFCVDNGPGQIPSPCGGGADTTGSTGASQWISNNPPSYAEGLTIRYGAGGSFQVQVKVSPTIGDVDCTVRTCSVITRADHSRASDRSQDVRVPVTFAAAAAPAPSTAAPATGGTGSPGSAGNTGSPGNTGAGNTGGDGATTAPTAGAATGETGTATGETGTATGAAAAGTTEQVEITRTSSAASGGRWWPIALVGLGVAVALLLGRGLLRRRQADR